MKHLQYLLESTFTTKFNQQSSEQLAKFLFTYCCLLNAKIVDHHFRSDAVKLAMAIYSTGRFEKFRAGADDFYNTVAVLGTPDVAEEFNKETVSERLPSLVTQMLRDMTASGNYNVREAERHLMGIQRALKLTGDSVISEFRRNCQRWRSLLDQERKLIAQKMYIFLLNNYNTSSAVRFSKDLEEYYRTQVS
jgi:hypothetical protein